MSSTIVSLFFLITLTTLTSTSAKGLFQKKLPVCLNHLLDKRSYRYEKWVKNSYGSITLHSTPPNEHSCRLQKYTAKNAVKCFDLLYQEKKRDGTNISNKTKKDTEFHVIFMGDSRIRQQFFNFLKLIPDYDQIMKPAPIIKFWVPFHGDIDVYSSLLGLRVSFRWCHVISDSIVDMVRQWTLLHPTEQPNIFFLSMEIYHMMQKYGADFKLYQQKLLKLGAVLDQLSNASQVIWLNQYPTVEFYGKIQDINTDIHTQKIHQYNEAVRRVYRNHKHIRVWDSSNLLAEEYVRGCTIFEREIPDQLFLTTGINQFIHWKPFINCLDFAHTGYVALSEATQLLYNDICNLKFLEDRNH